MRTNAGITVRPDCYRGADELCRASRCECASCAISGVSHYKELVARFRKYATQRGARRSSRGRSAVSPGIIRQYRRSFYP